MVYKISLPLVGSTGTRKKEIIDADNNLVIDEIRVGSATQIFPSFLGLSFGYVSGGTNGQGQQQRIEKFPFATDANSADVGDFANTFRKYHVSGQSSATHGYVSGGYTYNYIDKFPFSADTNATDVGDLTQSRGSSGGQSSTTHGYTSGGTAFYNAGGTPVYNTIDKFPFAADANATDVGDLTQARSANAGQSSDVSGYSSGGGQPYDSIFTNIIDKFPFSADANATDVGDLTQARNRGAGQSSGTNGYNSGAQSTPTTASNIIDKFPFSSDANATDVGDLAVPDQHVGAGQSATTHGYTTGGVRAPYPLGDIIEKFPFASDANSTEIANTSGEGKAFRHTSGQQV